MELSSKDSVVPSIHEGDNARNPFSDTPKCNRDTRSTQWAITLSCTNMSDLNETDNVFWIFLTERPLLKETVSGKTVDFNKEKNVFSIHYLLTLLQKQTAGGLFQDFFDNIWCSTIHAIPEKGYKSKTEVYEAYYTYLQTFDPLRKFKPDEVKIREVMQRINKPKIINMHKAGVRTDEIQFRLQVSGSEAKSYAHFRTPRTTTIKKMYIYGKSGLGKTTAVTRVLKGLYSYGHSQKKDFDYYVKPEGLTDNWHWFDNEPIVFVDNAAPEEVGTNEMFWHLIKPKDIGNQKVVSNGYDMVFDPKLVIICSNSTPNEIVGDLNKELAQPYVEKLQEYCCFELTHDNRDELYGMLFSAVKDVFGVEPNDYCHLMPLMSIKINKLEAISLSPDLLSSVRGIQSVFDVSKKAKKRKREEDKASSL